ncbi:hypothetical protein OPT61_g6192 [Boeremia exigua]|uniref:Uncharacterized protein n=1 Tax=Boeremia exigua TaxID=749465 RepID=A0ACC2I7J6_9PLEO|nr:hypothetical protein OPT61_g6192 [Boeremia exigua]
MPQQQHNINALKEAQIQLALQALKQDANLSQRRAAAIYNVPQATLSNRSTGRPSRADTMPNSRGLDNNKEKLADVAAIANSLRAERKLGPVSTNWPSTLPNSVLSALEHYAKGGAILLHKLVLAQQQIAELQAANEAATRRKSHKRKRVQKEGTLIVEDGQRLAALKEFGARSDGKRAKKQVRTQEGEPSQRRCRRCNQTGHNARTFRYREPKRGVLGHNRSGFGVVLAKVIDSPVDRLAREVRYKIF